MSSGMKSKKNQVRTVGVVLIIIAIIFFFMGYSSSKDQLNYNFFLDLIGAISALIGGGCVFKPNIFISIFTFIKNEEHNEGSSLNTANINQSKGSTGNNSQVFQGNNNQITNNIYPSRENGNDGSDRDNWDRIIAKAKDINTELITPLKLKNEEIIVHFLKKTFVEQKVIDEKLSNVVLDTSFDEIIGKITVIQINEGNYRLIYTQDEYLNNHFSNINSSLLIFKENMKEIMSVINEIYQNPISESLEQSIAEMCKDSGKNISDITRRNRTDRLRWILYSYVLDNPNIYRSGQTVLINLLHEQHADICKLLDEDDEISGLKKRFQAHEEQILHATNKLEMELNGLITDWQNNYYI